MPGFEKGWNMKATEPNPKHRGWWAMFSVIFILGAVAVSMGGLLLSSIYR